MATAVAQHMDTSSSSHFTQVKVNVRLCGSIPRTEMDSVYRQQSQQQQNADSVAKQLCSQLSTFQQQQQHSLSAPTGLPTFEPPSWAVPASGEARLEVNKNMDFYILCYI
jgi:hypothetical protein